jgi:hypothetical protein
MTEAVEKIGIRAQAVHALKVALIIDLALGIFAAIIYSMAPTAAIARVLDTLRAPMKALTLLIASGYTGLQPVLAMLLSVLLSWGAVWVSLNAYRQACERQAGSQQSSQ